MLAEPDKYGGRWDSNNSQVLTVSASLFGAPSRQSHRSNCSDFSVNTLSAETEIEGTDGDADKSSAHSKKRLRDFRSNM